MRDELYDERACGDGEFDYATGPLLTEIEPAFDAASFVRFGRDIFWQPDLVSNQFGADWLQSYFPSLDNGIDTTAAPVSRRPQ